MLNRIVLQGRLTRDPDKRMLPSGKAVTSFTLACDRDFKNQNGEKETDFIDCVCFGGLADTVSKYFTKGRMAVVDGRLQIRDWTDKEGNKRRSAEILANNVYFADSKKEGTDNNVGSTWQPNQYQQAAAAGYTAPASDPARDFEQIPEDAFGPLPF